MFLLASCVYNVAMNQPTNPKGNKMNNKLFYVHNGSYVQHVGDRESCEQYIRNSRDLFGVTGLTIMMEVNGKYRPAIFVN